MISEAEVFLQADAAAVRVFTTIRTDQWDLELPPVFDMPGADQPSRLRQAINHYAYDNAWVPDMLAGRTMEEVGRDRYDGDRLGADPADSIRRISAAAERAAREVTDPAMPVHCSYGDCPAADYFWQLNIARTLSAQDVAVLIGLDMPLPEPLCEAMFEGTAPSAELWRSFGIYREPAGGFGGRVLARSVSRSHRTQSCTLTGHRRPSLVSDNSRRESEPLEPLSEAAPVRPPH